MKRTPDQTETTHVVVSREPARAETTAASAWRLLRVRAGVRAGRLPGALVASAIYKTVGQKS